MRVYLTHHWKRYEGQYVLSVLTLSYGNLEVTITILNFTLGIEL
jgi:hypothetical protein